jgi:hypothetical protein
MNLKLRRARPTDAEAFIEVKRSLPMPSGLSETAEGGFLLGTNLQTYRFFIENAFVNVLDAGGRIAGFAIILPDRLLRSSQIWQQKDMIRWQNFDPGRFEERPICYFEQLAVLPASRYRFWGISLAYLTLSAAFATHDAMFATVVKEPVFNRAALPLIEDVGGQYVGEADEVYPEVGRLLSRVYLIERDIFRKRTAKHRLFKKVLKQIESAIHGKAV